MKTTKLQKLVAIGALGVSSVTGIALAAPAGAADSTAGHPSQHSRFAQLTAEQRQCLSDQGLTRPQGRPTRQQFEKLRKAAKDCGITIPANAGRHWRDHGRSPFASLTAEQRQCLSDQGVTRPDGRPTREQIAKLRTAAAECGIALPTGRPAV